jgi:hypothetical protein
MRATRASSSLSEDVDQRAWSADDLGSDTTVGGDVGDDFQLAMSVQVNQMSVPMSMHVVVMMVVDWLASDDAHGWSSGW